MLLSSSSSSSRGSSSSVSASIGDLLAAKRDTSFWTVLHVVLRQSGHWLGVFVFCFLLVVASMFILAEKRREGPTIPDPDDYYDPHIRSLHRYRVPLHPEHW